MLLRRPWDGQVLYLDVSVGFIARGASWGGREVIRAPVVYIAAEGAGEIKSESLA